VPKCNTIIVESEEITKETLVQQPAGRAELDRGSPTKIGSYGAEQNWFASRCAKHVKLVLSGEVQSEDAIHPIALRNDIERVSYSFYKSHRSFSSTIFRRHALLFSIEVAQIPSHFIGKMRFKILQEYLKIL
jgi:hypothetical protein